MKVPVGKENDYIVLKLRVGDDKCRSIKVLLNLPRILDSRNNELRVENPMLQVVIERTDDHLHDVIMILIVSIVKILLRVRTSDLLQFTNHKVDQSDRLDWLINRGEGQESDENRHQDL